ncbi:hypothetical protein GH714_013362 [Hevea brasiliensis]|uniref:AB hydrolase-1 domain-containing protein n=1 Tax=Hevea brasiliensis TaxID=3981 RepID=A0A6A6MJ55_HEVBR|nr:hypothetical protein GH714_013362 [Hevea brasiliensis]
MAASLLSLFQPNLSSPIRPLAVLNKSRKMRIPYELKQGQTRLLHQLPSGLNMEVIEQKGIVCNTSTDPDYKRSSENPPLVFVHGSYHAAWCWAEHWLPFFSSCGYDCYALSLLGQGESDGPVGSFAGSLQKLYPDLAGAVLVCSVPPSGNSGLVWRYLFSKPIAAFKELMRESSRMPLFDLRKLNASLPVPSVPKSSVKVLVVGASDDFIVDAEGLHETGRFYGVSPICVEGVAHDMMLDCSWEEGAKVILSWLNGLSR